MIPFPLFTSQKYLKRLDRWFEEHKVIINQMKKEFLGLVSMDYNRRSEVQINWASKVLQSLR